MRKVGHDVNSCCRRAVCTEYIHEQVIRVEFSRIKGWHLCSDSNDLHVINTPDLLNDGFQFQSREYQRIAACEQHIGDLGMTRDVLQPQRNVFHNFMVIIKKKTFAETEPTIRAANIID